MERWVVAAKRADFAAIGKEFGIDPVIARLIRNRDVQDRVKLIELKSKILHHQQMLEMQWKKK